MSSLILYVWYLPSTIEQRFGCRSNGICLLYTEICKVVLTATWMLCVLSHFSCVWLFVTPWTAAHQAPLSGEFSRQEDWSGVLCLSPGNLPDPGIEPTSLMSLSLTGRFFTTSATWETPRVTWNLVLNERKPGRVKLRSHLVPLWTWVIIRCSLIPCFWGFPGGITGKESTCQCQRHKRQEMWVQSLGWEDTLEEGMATLSSILAQRIPWIEEPGGLWPTGSQKVEHNWSDLAQHTSLFPSERCANASSSGSSSTFP